MRSFRNARQAIRSKVDTRRCTRSHALKLVKDSRTAKFDESVDVSGELGIDAKKSTKGVARLGRASGDPARPTRCVFAQSEG